MSGIGIERDGDSGVIVISERLEKVRGDWYVTAWDGDKEYNEHGRCITPMLWWRCYENLITTVGKQLVLDRLFGIGGAVALAGTGVGTSATAAATGNTALTGEVYKAYASTPTRSGQAVTAITSYTTAEANISINEAGLLTSAGGVLFNRVAPFLGFTKSTAVALDVTTVISQS